MSTAVAIVTITRNDAEGLERTLASIAEQTINPAEVVIVDGLSEDKTPDVVARFCRPEWQYVREEDSGVYDAMNKGWRATSAPYVQFLNSGDVFAGPTSLATYAEAIATGTPQWVVAGATRPWGTSEVTIGNLPHSWWRHALGVQSHCHQSCLFRRELMLVLNGFDEGFSFAADFDFILRAGLVAPPLEIHVPLVRYQGGGMSDQRAREIPAILHRVRKERLQLSRRAEGADWLWMMSRRMRQEAVWLRDGRGTRPRSPGSR